MIFKPININRLTSMSSLYSKCYEHQSRNVSKARVQRPVQQVFDHLLILDFEATCDSPVQLTPCEIIEFPCICLETEKFEPISTFHHYVRPTVNPMLTNFCTELTGITQDQIDPAETFQTIFDRFEDWMINGVKLINETHQPLKTFAFVTCGNWDLKSALPTQLGIVKRPIPVYMTRWINCKKSFFITTKSWPGNLDSMMGALKLNHCGRLHSGIDDCKNIVNIVKELAHRGHVFKYTDWIKNDKH